MNSSAMRGVRRGILLAATGIIMAAGPARAQEMDEQPQRSELPPGAIVQPLDTGPGAELRRNLTTLAENPRSLEALIGAGRAANAMGDGEAALGFFARADEISPGDARVKAGMGSALVQMERPDQALSLFSQATALGAPEAEIAGDRGLAHDMLGDPRRAQQDYALVLRRRPDAEIERRLALSLAISGQRDAALRVIDGQLRRHDRAAWRTQAFVLALTGDARGAEDTAARMMPAANAQEMAPFFARLAALTPAEKAAAVHFGRFPSSGRGSQMAAHGDTRADPGALALAQSGPAAQPGRTRPQPAEPLNAAPRRRPGTAEGPVGTLIRTPRREEAPPVEPRRPVELAQNDGDRFGPPPPEPEDAKPAEEQGPPAAAQPPREAPAFTPGATFTLEPGGERPPPARVPPQPAPARRGDFGDVAAMVQSLPQEAAPARPAPARSARTAPPAAAASARQARPAEPPARGQAARNPARHWVQLAHAGAQSVLPHEFAEARADAPALLGSRGAYAALTDRVYRLLVGPFDTPAAARAFVRQLERREVEAIAWTSPAGQEIERLRIPDEPRTARNQPPQPEQRTAARGSRSGRAEPQPGSGTRGSRSRAASTERSSARGGREESGAGRRTPATRASRGRSEPEPRTPSRRRRPG